MRALVHRVSRAEVEVDAAIVGRIDRGFLVYIGVTHQDSPDDARYLADKIRHLRVFEDSAGKMNLDIAQAGGAVLAVSSFTLYADTRQGRRPAFTGAAPPDQAERLYVSVCDGLRLLGLRVETGRFGQKMRVSSDNDGPINLVLDSVR